MKNTTWLLLLILLLATNINAQITLIPDANFEQELVNQGIDSDATVNGQILNDMVLVYCTFFTPVYCHVQRIESFYLIIKKEIFYHDIKLAIGLI